MVTKIFYRGGDVAKTTGHFITTASAGEQTESLNWNSEGYATTERGVVINQRTFQKYGLNRFSWINGAIPAGYNWLILLLAQLL